MFELANNYVLPFSVVSFCYLLAACISAGLCFYVRRRRNNTFTNRDIHDIVEREELTAEIKEIEIKEIIVPETKEVGENS